MGWIGSAIERAESIDELYDAWSSAEGDIPARAVHCNSLKCVGKFRTDREAEAALRKANVCGMGYAEVCPEAQSARLRDAEALLSKEAGKLRAFSVSSSVYKTHHGKTVGCQRCGSSFPRDYFDKDMSRYFYGDDLLCTVDGRYVNECPICGADLRSETARTRIEGYKANVRKYRARVEELREGAGKKLHYLYLVHAYCG